MTSGPKGLKQRLEDFMADLKRAGVKTTPQRVEIFKEVARSTEHPDVETIFRGVRQRLPGVSLDTVYRTLWMLLEWGSITTLGPLRDRLRFDGDTAPHHHFTCRKCGLIHDFHNPEFDRLIIPAEVMANGRVEKIQVEFRGICEPCRAQQGALADNKATYRKRRLKNG